MFVTVFIVTFWGMVCIQLGEADSCDTGFYENTPLNDTTSRCLACSLCPPGSRVLNQCSNSTDTVCALCPKGSFSLEWNRSEYCVPCTRCSLHQQRNACSRTSDTVCKPGCSRGYYWDQSASDCLRCSYCPPGAPQERVYECEQNGASEDYLCAEGATLRARMVAYRPRFKNYRQLDRLAHEYPRGHDGTSPADLFTGLSVDLDQVMTSPWPDASTFRPTTALRSTAELWTTSITSSISSAPLTSTPHPRQRSSSSLWSGLTTSDILVTVAVITFCGVLSFVITAVICHFLMKAGVVKATSATVAVAGERPLVKGWIEPTRRYTMRLSTGFMDQEVI